MAKCYVTMNDKFMSGWGCASGKINKLVFECDSYREAEIVAENARKRSEMKYINISSKKPSYSSNRYYAQWFNKEEHPNWYMPNAF